MTDGNDRDARRLDAAIYWLRALDNKAMGEEVQGHARTLLDALALPCSETETVWRANWATDWADGASDDLHTEADALRMACEYHRRNPGAKVWIWSHEVRA